MSISNAEISEIYALTGLGKIQNNPGGNVGKNPAAQTIPVEATVSTLTPSGGVMDLTAIYLLAGQTIYSIAFITNAAASSPTHWWWALYDDGRGSTVAGQLALLSQTPDQGAGALTATTIAHLNLSPYWVTQYTGIYYVASMQTASVSIATFYGSTRVSTAAIQISPNCTNGFYAMTAGSGLTTNAPNPSGTLSASVRTAYAVVL